MSIISAWGLVAGILLVACGGEEQPAPASGSEPSAATTADVSRSKPIDVSIDQCTFTENASIYERPAAQWRAEHTTADGNLNLTAWRMHAGGAHQFNLHVQQGDQTYRINTVEGSTLEGSGSVTVTAQGGGAKFDITGQDQSGNDLRATVSCATLVEPVAEGG